MNRKKQHEIEENEVVGWLEQKIESLKPYSRQIMLGLTVAVVLVAAAFLWVFLGQKKEETQNRDYQTAFSEAYQSGTPDSLTDVADLYPDTNVAMIASIEAGDMYLKIGLGKLAPTRFHDKFAGIKQIKKAKEYYKSVIDSNTSAANANRTRAIASLGYACESLGEYDEAIDFYDQVVELGEDTPFYDLAFRGIVRCDLGKEMDFVAMIDTIDLSETGEAPNASLPRRPDISFPEPEEETAPGENKDGTAEEKPDGDAENQSDLPPSPKAGVVDGDKENAAKSAEPGAGTTTDEAKAKSEDETKKDDGDKATSDEKTSDGDTSATEKKSTEKTGGSADDDK